MNWIELQSIEGIDKALEDSKGQVVLIYKHSTRCSISAAALDRLERRWSDAEMGGVSLYFLDLIRYREVSNKIAEQLNVVHQSPQAIMIKNGKVIYEASHFSIDYQEILSLANSAKEVA